jgi:hypothetical protein
VEAAGVCGGDERQGYPVAAREILRGEPLVHQDANDDAFRQTCAVIRNDNAFVYMAAIFHVPMIAWPG